MGVLYSISNWYFTKKALPFWGILILDCAITLLSGFIASFLYQDGIELVKEFWPVTFGLLVTTCLFAVSFRLFHTYSGIIRFSSFVDLQHVAVANAVGAAATLLVSFVTGALGVKAIVMPAFAAICILFVLNTLLMWLMRVMVKILYDSFRLDITTQNVFIYGVHAGGVGIATSIQSQNPLRYKVVGFVTPDEELYSQYLMGALVRHDSPRLIGHMKEKNANILIVSPLEIDHFRTRQELISDLIANGIKIMIQPPAEEWDGNDNAASQQFHEVNVEDLLPRDKIEVDMEAIGRLLKDKVILITGAAGSIGFEIVRQVAAFGPKEMVLIDQAETPMHDIRLRLSNRYPNIKAETIVSSITDAAHMERIFSDHRPNYVFHAAAYKHVPMMENNPAQAVRNNVHGTRIIADLAVKYGVQKFVMISTDKAVNPTNVMGCSKRICEIYCQSLNKAIVEGRVSGKTQFVTTRFGNVLGSNGSVIPLFREQIKNGGPITVTHPDIIRYFMLIPEACKLVLEAGTMGNGGEIFVFDMGMPVKIAELVKRMISLSGAKDVEIKYIGLRDGEKLYEEVLSNEESTKPTMHPKIKVAQVREYDYEVACANEDRLEAVSESFDAMEIVKTMKDIVPEYHSTNKTYESINGSAK